MNTYFLILTSFLIPSFLFHDSSASRASYSEKNGVIQIAKSEKKDYREESKSEGDRVIEEYEREKLAKFKRNIGKRYLVVRTARPVEFYGNLEEQSRSFILLKDKEGFLVTEVIQNRSGTMNFYHVVFDSGERGYLIADGNYLGIKTLERGIIPLSRAGTKDKIRIEAVRFPFSYLTSIG